jgi:hypothetical protein
LRLLPNLSVQELSFDKSRAPKPGELSGTSWLRVAMLSGLDEHDGIDPQGFKLDAGYGLYSGGRLTFTPDSKVQVADENACGLKGCAAATVAVCGSALFETDNAVGSPMGSGAWKYKRDYACKIQDVAAARYLVCVMRDRWTDDLDASAAKIKDPKDAPVKSWLLVFSQEKRS